VAQPASEYFDSRSRMENIARDTSFNLYRVESLLFGLVRETRCPDNEALPSPPPKIKNLLGITKSLIYYHRATLRKV